MKAKVILVAALAATLVCVAGTTDEDAAQYLVVKALCDELIASNGIPPQ